MKKYKTRKEIELAIDKKTYEIEKLRTELNYFDTSDSSTKERIGFNVT